MSSLDLPHGHFSPKYELDLMTLFEHSILDRLWAPWSTLPPTTRRELVGIQNDHPRLRLLYRFILDHTAICATSTKDYERTVAGDVKRVLKGQSSHFLQG